MTGVCTSQLESPCGKPVVAGLLDRKFDCCEQCIKDLLSSYLESQRDLKAEVYSDQETSKFSLSPEPGKCRYRMMRGPYKGWYCASDCFSGFDCCYVDINRILGRSNYKDETQAPDETNSCLRIKITCCSNVSAEGFEKCSQCIKVAISKLIGHQRDLVTSPCRYSSTQPEKGKCQYRQTDGIFRGWYCAADCVPDFDFCQECVEKAVPRMPAALPGLPSINPYKKENMLTVVRWKGDIYRDPTYGFLVKEDAPGVIKAVGKDEKERNLTEDEKVLARNIGMIFD